jgi:hypothetical protein
MFRKGTICQAHAMTCIACQPAIYQFEHLPEAAFAAAEPALQGFLQVAS